MRKPLARPRWFPPSAAPLDRAREGEEYGAHRRHADRVSNLSPRGRDQATVNNTQSVATLDLDVVRNLFGQARTHLAALPAKTREGVFPILEQAEREMAKAAPNRPKLAGLLRDLKDTLVGAAGNVIAQGIIVGIGLLLQG